MAGSKKKPAKPIAGQSKVVVQDPAIYGTMVKYWGGFGAFTTCATCGKKTIRGMIRVKNEIHYCSAGCASSGG